MNTNNSAGLHELAFNHFHQPAISIFLPFDPKMTSKDAIKKSLSDTVLGVGRALQKKYTGLVIDLMEEKLNALLTGLNYNTNKRSIAIFVSPVFEKVLYMDMDVEPKILVDEQFDIREIIYSKKKQHRFLVLVVGSTEANFFQGEDETLKKLASNTSVSIHAYINDGPEAVANFTDPDKHNEIILHKFLRHVDDSLSIILDAYHLPLFIVAPKRIYGHFKKITRHAGAIIDYIHGSFENATTQELSALLNPFVSEWKKVKEKNFLRQLNEAADRNQLATGMKDVRDSALGHRGRLLLVEKDLLQEYRHDDPEFSNRKPLQQYSPVKDSIDEVIQHVLESGGDVEFVEDSLLKDFNHIALIKYY